MSRIFYFPAPPAAAKSWPFDQLSLAGTRFDSDPNYNANLQQYYREALQRLRAAPGVDSAAMVDFLPLLSNMFEGAKFRTAAGRKVPISVVSVVSPGYFETMGSRILYGRDFLPNDRQPFSQLVIINQHLARHRTWPAQSILGCVP